MTAPGALSPGAAIAAESRRLVASRADLSGFGPLGAAVVGRVIHASADLDYAHTMIAPEDAVAAGVAAIAAGAPVLADVHMTRIGLSGVTAHCALGDPAGPDDADGLTRTAAAMRLSLGRHPEGAVVVVGCAPTALAEVLRLCAAGAAAPALVIGLPVGFVGAAESKDALRASGLPAVSNCGEKGGSAVAAAAANAVVELARR
jgi:precorrin-8X/cobalt-precorrin-8 methylmutase